LYLKSDIRFNNNYIGTVLYFAALSASTGTASLRYKKTAAVSGIQGSVLSGDYIFGKY